jgi:Mg2+/Co2+ transporter CorB
MERLQEIPDAACCVRFDDSVVEVVQVDEQAIRSARVIRGKRIDKARGQHG